MSSTDETLSALLHEERRFAPDHAFAAQANGTQALYDEADADRLAFWGRQAREHVTWHRDFDEVLDWSDAPFAKWFVGGQLNVSYNCLDRHVEAGRGDKVAFHFVGEREGDERDWTYAQLLEQVERAANALRSLGVETGDRVAIYLPMIPEAAIAMLACARIGAPHTVIFGGFSSDAIRARVADAEAKVVVTADGQFRRGKSLPLKAAVDEALAGDTSVEKVLVVQRTGQGVYWEDDRDLWWHDALAAADPHCEPVVVDSEHPLFILYTSGTTGKPKGVFHTTGGYLTQAVFTHWAVHDVKVDTDVFWCTADVGWVTGHSYVVYGPLALGTTQVLYEGTPDSPHQGRWWQIVQDKGVTILYTAPTAIRSFMKWGREIPDRYDLSSLRLLGSVGEPINPEAWVWYREVIGAGRTPVIDTWWQTETGAMMISILPGVVPAVPGSAQRAVPGIGVDVVDDAGESVGNGRGGYLVLTEPWPAMMRGVWGDPQRFVDTYWSTYPGRYFAGDGAKRDEDGNIWILGRVDDVMNVSGHRLSTTEIESALVSHPLVAEAGVVGAADALTGQAVVAFVVLREEVGAAPDGIVEDLRAHVGKVIGPIAKPSTVVVVADLPKTRSSKIIRRLLKEVAEERDGGDTTTLADPSVMDAIRAGMAQARH